MQDQLEASFAASLVKVLTLERLTSYTQSPYAAGSSLHAIALYMHNASISEALYPILQNFEVGLRNNMHEAISYKLKTPDWWKLYYGKFREDETKALDKAVLRLSDDKKPIDTPHVIAALNLGFWQGLFTKHYQLLMWDGNNIARVLPHAPDNFHNRKNVYERLDSIRILRNRVFHYEPIWHWDDLKDQHKDVLEVIGWLNPELHKLTRMFDRFHKTVSTSYEERYNWLIQCLHQKPAPKPPTSTKP